MHDEPDTGRRHAESPWADEQTRQHLQVLVEGVATLAGFAQSSLTLRRDGHFEVVAAAGVEDGFVGTQVPAGSIENELRDADEWGVWRFVPHDRASVEALSYSHIPDVTPLEGEDAWHPLDLLAAPLHDDQGRLRGLLSVDIPDDGRLPSPEKMEVLTKYAGLARTLVLLALEREELSEQVRMATEVRAIVRQALGEPTLELVLEACRSAVVSCFDAVGMWLTAFNPDGVGSTTTSYAVGNTYDAPPFAEIDDVVVRLSRRYWKDQYVAPFSRDSLDQPGLARDDAERLLGFLDRIGIGSVLFVPLGVGRECVGFLVLTRVSDARRWTDIEIDAARDIGRDLGLAVGKARQLELERAIADRLRKLDSYRVEVVNTMGHELRNPLFSMSANLELLDTSGLDEDGRRSVAAATRGATRMRAVIDDMLTMAQVSDPHREFDPIPVDLRRVVHDVCDECHAAATAGGVTCESDAARRAGARARGARGAAPPAHQPRLQRDQVHRPRRPGDRARHDAGQLGRRHRRGHRHRHLAARPGAAVPRVLPLHQPGRTLAPRHRPRPGHRRADRRPPRRRDRHRLRARARHDGDPDAAGVRRGRQRGPSSIVMKLLSGSST